MRVWHLQPGQGGAAVENHDVRLSLYRALKGSGISGWKACERSLYPHVETVKGAGAAVGTNQLAPISPRYREARMTPPFTVVMATHRQLSDFSLGHLHSLPPTPYRFRGGKRLAKEQRPSPSNGLKKSTHRIGDGTAPCYFCTLPHVVRRPTRVYNIAGISASWGDLSISPFGNVVVFMGASLIQG